MSTTPSRQHKTSHFADAAAVDQAMRMALLMIQPSCKDKNVCGAGFLSIIVMKPGLDPRDTPFEEAILLEHAVGDKDEWDADYAAYAKAKARLSWETGLDGSVVQALQPQRGLPGRHRGGRQRRLPLVRRSLRIEHRGPDTRAVQGAPRGDAAAEQGLGQRRLSHRAHQRRAARAAGPRALKHRHNSSR
jgi:hypothetical protein